MILTHKHNISKQMLRNNIDKGKIMKTRYNNVEKCSNTIGWECRRMGVI